MAVMSRAPRQMVAQVWKVAPTLLVDRLPRVDATRCLLVLTPLVAQALVAQLLAAQMAEPA